MLVGIVGFVDKIVQSAYFKIDFLKTAPISRCSKVNLKIIYEWSP